MGRPSSPDAARCHPAETGATVAVPLYESDTDTVKSETATFFDVLPNGASRRDVPIPSRKKITRIGT